MRYEKYNRDMAEDWITTAQAAKLSGYHLDYIRILIRAGKVRAKKFGIVWQVDRASLLGYTQKAEKMGEKRGPKRKA